MYKLLFSVSFISEHFPSENFCEENNLLSTFISLVRERVGGGGFFPRLFKGGSNAERAVLERVP